MLNDGDLQAAPGTNFPPGVGDLDGRHYMKFVGLYCANCVDQFVKEKEKLGSE